MPTVGRWLLNGLKDTGVALRHSQRFHLARRNPWKCWLCNSCFHLAIPGTNSPCISTPIVSEVWRQESGGRGHLSETPLLRSLTGPIMDVFLQMLDAARVTVATGE